MIRIDDAWKNLYSGAVVGVMAVSNLVNPLYSKELERSKNELVRFLKERFKTKDELLAYEPVRAYVDYYKQYKKTYHVLPQIESVIFKGKSIPSVIPLVEVMFMAELQSGLLTAGHDSDALKWPLTVSVGKGNEPYTSISGKEQLVKANDMYIYDGTGVISSILGGPDARTKITPQTKNCTFIVYAPLGIGTDRIQQHFAVILQNIKAFAPKVTVDFCNVYTAE